MLAAETIMHNAASPPGGSLLQVGLQLLPCEPAKHAIAAGCSVQTDSKCTHVGRLRSTRAMPTVLAARLRHKSFTCRV